MSRPATFSGSTPFHVTFDIKQGESTGQLIVTGIPDFESPHRVSVLVHVLSAGQLQGEMELTLIDARNAVVDDGLWELINDTSLFGVAEELIELDSHSAPLQLLILERFERAAECSLGPRGLTRMVAPLFRRKDILIELGLFSCLAITYPFPLESFDESAAAALSHLYESEWGMHPFLEGGRLRAIALEPLEMPGVRDLPEVTEGGVYRSRCFLALLRSWGLMSREQRKQRVDQLLDWYQPMVEQFELCRQASKKESCSGFAMLGS